MLGRSGTSTRTQAFAHLNDPLQEAMFLYGDYRFSSHGRADRQQRRGKIFLKGVEKLLLARLSKYLKFSEVWWDTSENFRYSTSTLIDAPRKTAWNVGPWTPAGISRVSLAKRGLVCI